MQRRGRVGQSVVLILFSTFPLFLFIFLHSSTTGDDGIAEKRMQLLVTEIAKCDRLMQESNDPLLKELLRDRKTKNEEELNIRIQIDAAELKAKRDALVEVRINKQTSEEEGSRFGGGGGGGGERR